LEAVQADNLLVLTMELQVEVAVVVTEILVLQPVALELADKGMLEVTETLRHTQAVVAEEVLWQ
jgi:hypothetical protein